MITNIAALYFEPNLEWVDGESLEYFKALNKILPVINLIPDTDRAEIDQAKCNILIDWYSEKWKPLLPYRLTSTVPQPNALLLHHSGNKDLDQAALSYDHVFCAQYADFLALKITDAHKTWLPCAVDTDIYRKGIWDGSYWQSVAAPKKWDICFIGSICEEPSSMGSSRLQLLDAAFSTFPNFYFGMRTAQDPTYCVYQDAAYKYNQSRIVINCSRADRLERRVFEALATGSLLITNEVAKLNELFVDGKELVTYRSIPEALNKIAYYLEHQDEATKIAEAGYELVRSKHTYRNRVLELKNRLNI